MSPSANVPKPPSDHSQVVISSEHNLNVRACCEFLKPQRRPLFLLLSRLPIRISRLGQIPRLNNPALRLVHVTLVFDTLDANLDTVLCPYDVLAVHALGCGLADLLRADVDVVADEGSAGEDEEEED